MQPDPQAEGRRWLAQAEQDLEDARFSQQGKRYHLACFLAQQAGEKALKAYLYSRGEEHVWGHSVAELGQRVVDFEPSFKSLLRTGAALDKYYIPTRYPNGLPGGLPSEAFEASDAEQAISNAIELISFVKRRYQQR